MVEVVYLLLLFSEVLHHLASHEIALQLLNVVFDVLGFMGDREVKGIVPQAEAQGVEPVFQPSLGHEVGVNFPDEVVLTAGSDEEGAGGLPMRCATLGRGRIPVALH